MEVEIQLDPGAGPCFGVQRAIQMTEEVLNEQDQLACLGDLVHNDEEIRRLESKGLKIISHCQLVEQSGKKLLLRTHGEPPSTFRIASRYGIELIDATCPIVRHLQKEVAKACDMMAKQKGQVVLFGNLNHAEIDALKGYCHGEYYVVSTVYDVENLDVNKNTILFSQTTKYQSEYSKIVHAFEKKRKREKAGDYTFEVMETTCKFASERDAQLVYFLRDIDVFIFVSGSKSVNGRYLFELGKQQVRKAFIISHPDELQLSWFKPGQKIGISGATSTPLWLLEETYNLLEAMLK